MAKGSASTTSSKTRPRGGLQFSAWDIFASVFYGIYTRIKNAFPKTFKEFLYRFTVSTLAAGASLILGLLSLGGMYALWPVAIVAIISFALAVVYEGEIYTQNIERAFDKLFTRDYFRRQLAKEFLKNICQSKNSKDLAVFLIFKRYTDAIHLNDEETLDAFEEKFHDLLTRSTPPEDPKDKLLFEYLHQKRADGAPSFHEAYKAKHRQRGLYIGGIKLFSIISAGFMGLGTTYLLTEAFSIIPIFAFIPLPLWPIIIAPMAAICGIAYGFLTFNAITNLLANDTIVSWYKKLRDNLTDDPWNIKYIAMAISASLLFAMAIVLTVCTAGTWWTIVQEIKPLFRWMERMPSFVMGIINPIVTGFSSLVFNIENTSETLEMIEHMADEQNEGLSFSPFWDACKKTGQYLWDKENFMQWLNPFRLILVLVVLPLRYLLFIGHLISIGVTSDRIPGLPAFISAFLGTLSEGGEDIPYFFKIHHPSNLNVKLEERLGESQGHDHHQDLPSWLIEKLAWPIYFLSALWDGFFSLFNRRENWVTPQQAWDRQTKPFIGAEEKCTHDCLDHTHSAENHQYEAMEEGRPTSPIKPHRPQENCQDHQCRHHATPFGRNSLFCTEINPNPVEPGVNSTQQAHVVEP